MTYYNIGAASVAAGGKVVSFTGAGLGSKEFPFIKPGELFFDPAQPLVPGQRIASVDYEAQTATLWVGWPGISLVSAPYEVRLVDDAVRSTRQSRRYIEMAGQLTALGIQPNAFGQFSDRAAYNEAGKGFIFLSLNGDGVTGVWTLYTKLSATSGDWSAGQTVEGPEGKKGDPSTVPGPPGPANTLTIGTVESGPAAGATITGEAPEQALNLVLPKGDPGLIGDWRGAWAPGTYNELEAVEHNDSSYIVKEGVGSTTQEPPGSDWKLVAAKGGKGDDGLGVPAGGTTGQVLKKASNADNDTVWGGGSQTLYFTADGTYTRSPGCASVDIVAIGAGGGSSGCQGGAAQVSMGNAGAAGAEAHKHLDFEDAAITGITKGNPGVVTAPGHEFRNGTVVSISGVAGMVELNGNTYTVVSATTDTFQLSGTNTSGFGTYVSGGAASFVSCPVVVGEAGIAGIGGGTPTAGGNGETTSFGGCCEAEGGDGGTITGITSTGTTVTQSNQNFGGDAGVGDLVIPGQNSNRGLRLSGSTFLGTNTGGNHRFGRGGRTIGGGDGFSGLGYGSGAGGPIATDATHRNGAAGAPGLLIVVENF